MKKSLLFCGLLLLGIAAVNAQTAHTVLVGNNGFTPSNLTVTVGDNVTFQLDLSNNSGSHTSTCITCPTGVNCWDYTCFCASCKYTSVINVAGTYELVDSTSGKTGTITATVVSGITKVGDTPDHLSQNHPNPFSSITYIDYNLNTVGGLLLITDVTGKVIAEYPLNEKSGQVIIDENLSAGTYFYSLWDNQNYVIDNKRMQVVE